ncbi:MAG: glycosyltransferase family 2 protein [Magnetococcales bacterium]|nr:glycosyltransferase family 2 protein [Magnetococcales bacterium]
MVKETDSGVEYLQLPIGSVSVVVPCKNEEDAIQLTIQGIKNALESASIEYEIIIVDDGSNDSTRQKAIEAGVRVLVHEINMGYGNSIMNGVKIAKHPVIAILDADGTYDPAELPKLLEALSRHDMVIGVRKWTPDNTSLTGRFFRTALYYTILILSGVKAPDFNSGFRVFHKKNILDYRPVLCPTFSFTTTLTVLFLQANHSVNFMPIEYSQRIGRSKVNYLKDAIKTFNYVFSITSILRPYRINMFFIVLAILMNGLVMTASLFSPFVASLQLGLHTIISVPLIIASLSLGAYVNTRIYHYHLNKKTGEDV